MHADEQDQEFIDVGCHSFSRSGFKHDEKARRFQRLVQTCLYDRHPCRLGA